MIVRRAGLLEVVEDGFVGHGLVVLALDALARVSTEDSLLEALAILLDAEGLAAGAPLAILGAIKLGRLGSSAGGDSLVHLGKLATLLVAAVHALAVLGALQSCRKTLAVQLHAFRVAAVAYFLLTRYSLRLHLSDFKFKNEATNHSLPKTYPRPPQHHTQPQTHPSTPSSLSFYLLGTEYNSCSIIKGEIK